VLQFKHFGLAPVPAWAEPMAKSPIIQIATTITAARVLAPMY
jgi:hypothetical protein